MCLPAMRQENPCEGYTANGIWYAASAEKESMRIASAAGALR